MLQKGNATTECLPNEKEEKFRPSLSSRKRPSMENFNGLAATQEESGYDSTTSVIFYYVQKSYM